MKKQILRLIVIAGAALLALGYTQKTGDAEQPEGAGTKFEVSIEENIQETTEELTEPTEEVTEPLEEYFRCIEGCPLDEETQRGIFDICERYNVDYYFTMSQIYQESKFNPNLVGDNGNSIGLMQVQPKWWGELIEELGVTDLYDPLQNVEVGVAIMAKWFEVYGGEGYHALMAYNGGYDYAERMIAAGEVSDYATEIMIRAYIYTWGHEAFYGN